MFPELSIIIVNWNLYEDTIQCIDSLLKAGATISQIIIVDNGSTDSSIAKIRSYYRDEISVIDAKENLGYAGGANLGIQNALSNSYKWILLLNNDTVVAEDFIKEMHRATVIGDKFSILAPIIYYHDNPMKIWAVGEQKLGHTLFTIDKYKNRSGGQSFPLFIPIDFVNGCAMLINKHVFEKIGLLDQSLFMYGEEVDFCWRAKLVGYRFACFTPAHISHKISKSSRNSRPNQIYLKIRNQVFFYQRYTHGVEKTIYFIFTLLRTIILCCLEAIKWRIPLISPALRGWWDGWFKYPLS